MEVRIEKAEKRDAEFISDTILRAVGHEIKGRIDDDQTDKRELRELFRLLAEREDTQYSFRNTLVARDDKGEALGALVSYDGADLKRLRKVFIETANRLMNWGIDEERIHDETGPGEIYIDSLMVLPEYRGKGIARKLILTDAPAADSEAAVVRIDFPERSLSESECRAKYASVEDAAVIVNRGGGFGLFPTASAQAFAAGVRLIREGAREAVIYNEYFGGKPAVAVLGCIG